MKYLSIIFGLIIITVALSFLLAQEDPVPTEDSIVMTVNGHAISDKAVKKDTSRFGYHDSTHDIYESIITRELLLQEAQRQQIDKEESFRTTLKTFYENSLIKILLERKNKEIQTTVSDEEINRYLSMLNKTITFTRLDALPSGSENIEGLKGETSSVLFEDLAEPLRLLLSSLQPGEYGVRFDTGSERYAIRLDTISGQDHPVQASSDKQYIAELIGNYKREQELSLWLDELKTKAQIKIHTEGRK